MWTDPSRSHFHRQGWDGPILAWRCSLLNNTRSFNMEAAPVGILTENGQHRRKILETWSYLTKGKGQCSTPLQVLFRSAVQAFSIARISHCFPRASYRRSAASMPMKSWQLQLHRLTHGQPQHRQ